MEISRHFSGLNRDASASAEAVVLFDWPESLLPAIRLSSTHPARQCRRGRNGEEARLLE